MLGESITNVKTDLSALSTANDDLSKKMDGSVSDISTKESADVKTLDEYNTQ